MLGPESPATGLVPMGRSNPRPAMSKLLLSPSFWLAWEATVRRGSRPSKPPGAGCWPRTKRVPSFLACPRRRFEQGQWIKSSASTRCTRPSKSTWTLFLAPRSRWHHDDSAGKLKSNGARHSPKRTGRYVFHCRLLLCDLCVVGPRDPEYGQPGRKCRGPRPPRVTESSPYCRTRLPVLLRRQRI